MYPKALLFGIGFYEIFIAVGMLLVLFLADKMAVKSGFSIKLQKHLIISAVIAVFLGFFGAVFFQAVYDWIATGEFSLNAGMTFYGGLIFGAGGFLISWFFLSKPFKIDGEARERFGTIADIAACMVPLAHAFGRLGCLFAGCCHGDITDAWYGVPHHHVTVGGVYYETAKVVPVQLFESMFLFALFGVLFWLFMRNKKNEKSRFPLLPVYLVAYGIWRFFIEYARSDDRGETFVSFLTPSQLIAVVLVVTGIAYFCLWFFVWRKRIAAKEIENSEQTEQTEQTSEIKEE